MLCPQGPSAVPEIPLAPRPPTLSQRRVAFVWDFMFRGDEIFPMIAEALTSEFGDMEFVSPETFGSTFGGDEHAVLDELPSKLAGLGVDAVIGGVGC